MQNQFLLATYTYPHEAVFIETALSNAGIHFEVNKHPSMIKNTYYGSQSFSKSIFIKKQDLKKVMGIVKNIHQDAHVKNRLNCIHMKELCDSIESSPSEKRICFYCYAVIFSALGWALFEIIQSLCPGC